MIDNLKMAVENEWKSIGVCVMKEIKTESQGTKEEGNASFPPLCSLGLLKDCELLQGPTSLTGEWEEGLEAAPES